MPVPVTTFDEQYTDPAATNKHAERLASARRHHMRDLATTSQSPGGAYDVAYDIWFNHTPVTSGPPDGGELMVWLAHRGGSQIAPGGSPVARVTIGRHAYTIWLWTGGPAARSAT